jgi:mRNA interferase MazF
MEFHQIAGGKIRPAVVLLDTGDDDFIAAPITSRARASEYDLVIQEWRAAGLNVPSFVRVHKLTVRPKSGIARQLGSLTKPDHDELIHILARAFRG